MSLGFLIRPEDVAAPMIATGARPKIAILRGARRNSHAEIGVRASKRAGFCTLAIACARTSRPGRRKLADFLRAYGVRAQLLFLVSARCLGAGYRAGPSRSFSIRPWRECQFEAFFPALFDSLCARRSYGC